MIRSRRAVLALAALLAACGSSKVSPPGVALSQPSAVAVFHGFTIGNTAAVDTYVAIANENRNDVSIVSATTDAAVLAPVSFRTLVVPAARPALLVSADLGDSTGGVQTPDLLAVVTEGSSSVQLIRTWTTENAVVDAETVDVGDEIVAAVAVPSVPGTARIALALAGQKIAIVEYKRDGSAIVAVRQAGVTTPTVVKSDVLTFQPLDLAVIRGSAAEPLVLYAATRDEIATGVHGVAEVTFTAADSTFSVRALDARAPTRLVAAARLRERIVSSTAFDETAFPDPAAPTSFVNRVYAVLDESGCGSSSRIDCGVAVLDPVAGGLLPDLTGAMPYLAPIPLPTRPLAIAVSPPPVNPPSTSADDAKYAGDLMRIWPAMGPEATTAVAGVACDDGKLYFLDVARWKVANDAYPLGSSGARALSVVSAYLDLPGTSPTVSAGSIRAWVTDASGAFNDASPVDGVATTPGYTRSASIAATFQGLLPYLTGRRSDAGLDPSGAPWIALQQESATGVPTSVVRVWDPALGIHAAAGAFKGDVVEIDASGVPGCTGTTIPVTGTTATTMVFDARVAALLPPTAAYPGGALLLARETEEPSPAVPDALVAWGTCFDALVSAVTAAPSGTVPALSATVRAGDWVVTSNVDGYIGRATATGVTTAAGNEQQAFTLQYPGGGTPPLVGEDALPACPLDPWPAATPPSAAFDCDATCRASCEALVLARKARRTYHASEGCLLATDPACATRWPTAVIEALPNVEGPVVSFRFGVEPRTIGLPNAPTPLRGMELRITTGSGVAPFAAGTASNQGSLATPVGVVPLDRSALSPSDPAVTAAGYRFLVPYRSSWVLDASPSLDKGNPGSIR